MDFLLDGFYEAYILLITFDASTYSALSVSLRASVTSILLALLIGMPLGFCLGYYHFWGRSTLKTIVDALTAIPTVVIGLTLYGFLSQRGLFGDMKLLFTIQGIIIGQMMLALPIVVSLTSTIIQTLDRKVFWTLKTLGAKGFVLIYGVIIEARYQLIGIAIVVYGRVISEIGISMMIGGNINYHTRTLTTAIALESGKGEFAQGIALGVILILISLVLNFIILTIKKQTESKYAL